MVASLRSSLDQVSNLEPRLAAANLQGPMENSRDPLERVGSLAEPMGQLAAHRSWIVPCCCSWRSPPSAHGGW
jgi:hypothetical protein